MQLNKQMPLRVFYSSFDGEFERYSNYPPPIQDFEKSPIYH